ncbi:MAG: TetR/AcrR family transcriptional regulator [Acidimicrobiales bacterium]
MSAPMLSRREQSKQANRERLYDAALDLFADRGYASVTVEDICARADVGRATFFRLYGTKAALLDEFSRRVAAEAEAQLARARPADATSALRIVAEIMCDAWISSGVTVRQMAQEYIHSVSLVAGSRSAQAELQELVSGIVRAGQERGELSGAPHPDFLGWMIVTALSGAIATWLGSDDILRRRSAQTIEVLLDGLRVGA